MQAPGRTLLKVTGILMLIVAIFAIIGAVGTLAFGGLAVAISGETDTSVALGGAFIILFGVVMLIQAVFSLVAAILGIKNANKPERATSCLIFGIIIAALSLLGLIFSGFSLASLVSTLFGLVVPGLYILGAVKNKQFAKTMQPTA